MYSAIGSGEDVIVPPGGRLGGTSGLTKQDASPQSLEGHEEGALGLQSTQLWADSSKVKQMATYHISSLSPKIQWAGLLRVLRALAVDHPYLAEAKPWSFRDRSSADANCHHAAVSHWVGDPSRRGAASAHRVKPGDDVARSDDVVPSDDVAGNDNAGISGDGLDGDDVLVCDDVLRSDDALVGRKVLVGDDVSIGNNALVDDDIWVNAANA
jgi:acetyltransferase-like isoleucine patch superfamily enzyme